MTKKGELYFASIFAIIFIIIGIALSYFGYRFYCNIQKIRKTGIKVQGRIIRFEKYKVLSSPSDYIITPIVRYKTLSGREFTVQGHVDNRSLFQNICETGQKVEIIYQKDNPKNALINTVSELWFIPLLSWIIGFFFILGPPFTIYRYLKDSG